MLIREVLWGNMSATKAQKIASATVSSGANTDQVHRLSKLGTSGFHKNNIWRDMKFKLGTNVFKSALVVREMPLCAGLGKARFGKVGILYPHVLFSLLYHVCYDQFVDKILGGCASNITRFWDSMVNHPNYATHPMKSNKKCPFKTKAVPISIHGDGVATTGVGKAWAKMCDVVSWTSLLPEKGSSIIGHFNHLFLHA